MVQHTCYKDKRDHTGQSFLLRLGTIRWGGGLLRRAFSLSSRDFRFFRCGAETTFFFLNHTAFKLYSLWHVGYFHDDLYGFYVCSRVSLLPYNPARCPDSPEPPLLLGLVPSYFPAVVTSHLPPYSPPPSNVAFPSSALRSNRSMSHESSLFFLPPVSCLLLCCR
jgi:hypothetical protein